MLDKTSKRVLEYMGDCPDNIVSYYDLDKIPDEIGGEDNFFAAIRYLKKMGYVEDVTDQDGETLGACLSHIATHKKEFSKIAFVEYMKTQWIAIAALIISIIALIRTW